MPSFAIGSITNFVGNRLDRPINMRSLTITCPLGDKWLSGIANAGT